METEKEREKIWGRWWKYTQIIYFMLTSSKQVIMYKKINENALNLPHSARNMRARLKRTLSGENASVEFQKTLIPFTLNNPLNRHPWVPECRSGGQDLLLKQHRCVSDLPAQKATHPRFPRLSPRVLISWNIPLGDRFLCIQFHHFLHAPVAILCSPAHFLSFATDSQHPTALPKRLHNLCPFMWSCTSWSTILLLYVQEGLKLYWQYRGFALLLALLLSSYGLKFGI